ncbi:hypothetical protein ACIQ9P_08095 [Kitasatospora sp. NPDC094019]|uniref:hypothetical protein n=1 Tax=Kitasatospora sp. NPDC094019 TaxID=3364091 RepID=UPI003806D2EC
MAQPDSVDPWSSFLSSAQSPPATAGSYVQSAAAPEGAPLSGTATELLRAVVASGPVTVDGLREQLGFSTLQMAQEVIVLRDLGLLEVQTQDGEDSLRLTESGTRFAARWLG